MSGPLILGTNSIKDTGYDVANSLRFNESDDCLIKTFGSAGNRKLWTYSVWFKRGKLGGSYALFVSGASGGNDEGTIRIEADKIDWQNYDIGTSAADSQLLTNALIRDPSAWYHLVCAYDSANSTAGNRMRMYLNGAEITDFATDNNPSLNYDTATNNAVLHNIGRQSWNSSADFSGYMAEICFIDGAALGPTSFGEFDEDSPTIWKPLESVKDLTFGNNGFYLEFKESGTGTNASGMGADTSGNTNHFAVNNLTATDQSTDTCTNNFATLNPLIEFYPSYTSTFSEGNLDITRSDNGGGLATIMPTQGKWYVEFKFITVGSGTNAIGVLPYDKITDNEFNVENKGVAYLSNGQKKVDGSASSYGNSYTANDIISIAINLDDGEAIFYKNGTAQNSGTAITGFTNNGAMAISCKGGGSTWKWSANFGSPSYTISSGNTDSSGMGNFEYAVPSGYYSLCTRNLNLIG
jgi:hypothetical protein